MKDGAHTHHGHRPGGLGLVLSIAAGLVLASVIRSILPALLIGLAIIAGLTVAGLIAWAVTTSSRDYDLARAIRAEFPHLPDADQDPKRVIAALQAELDAARASRAVEHHQHLHLHALDPSEAAAILAAQRPAATDRDGEAG